MLRDMRKAPSLKLDSGCGRADGLGEKLRDCAHFSPHTQFFTLDIKKNRLLSHRL